ncbi:NAD-dependent epimerase/dehydratase family protein [Bacillus coahuilensis]|uniref:NAD-dependent epimerase/dehydratase family protein n=1 Tax=Bacillus coahuilensis TaxID=408580 RepID=UPI0004941CA1|nr:NAD-dependent epimerase/dehydratase family protein [Bacillus coahuilensis]
MKVLVTGAAGFIGYSISKRLLQEGVEVVGVDNLNDYYDVRLKEARLHQLNQQGFTFYQESVENRAAMDTIFHKERPTHVIHFAGQAGVRYSLENPEAYINGNLVGFYQMMELSKEYSIQHFLFASSSSVYGDRQHQKDKPFNEEDRTDTPASLYAATKKSNEMMSYSYSQLFSIPVTGLRFFTVYGPWGRPDMAYYSFAQKMVQGESITVFHNGEMSRDYTYIDDAIESVWRLLHNPSEERVPYQVYNIGSSSPVRLTSLIEELELGLNKKAHIHYAPFQKGDVTHTFADVEKLLERVNYKPTTSFRQGMKDFIGWFTEYTGKG